MKNIKKNIMRIILSVECCVFAWVLLRGPHGIGALNTLTGENKALIGEISVLQTQVQELEHTIVALKTHYFYKEKIAREQLQMARHDEIIYYY